MLRIVGRVVSSVDARALLLLILEPFVFFWPATLGFQVFLGNDIFFLFYPIRLELARRLAEGQLPLWTTTLQGGFPLLAESQVGALYPLNWILYRFLPIHIALSYSVLLHMAWVAIGMYLFVRANGIKPIAALLGAASFAWGGFVIARPEHLSVLGVIAWTPWLFWCGARFRRESETEHARVYWFVGASLCVCFMLLSGHPQTAALGLTLFLMWSCFQVVFLSSHMPPLQSKYLRLDSTVRRIVLMPFLPLCLGAGLAAAQLLPLAELVQLSVRGQGIGAGNFLSFSLDPFRLIHLVFPFWSGGPFDANIEFWAYLGILPLGLALLAVPLLKDRRTALLLGIAVVAIALALGKFNPLYPLLYYVPIFNQFRVPARFMFWFVFSASFLAAIALDRLTGDSITVQQPSPRVIVVFIFLLLGSVLLVYQQEWEFWLNLWKVMPWLLGFAGIAILVAKSRRLITPGTAGVIIVGLTLVDLVLFAAPFRSTVSRTGAPEELAVVPRSVRQMDNSAVLYRVLGKQFFPLADASRQASLQPDRATIFGKDNFDIGLPLALDRNSLYLKTMSPAMANVANIRYYLTPLELPAFPPHEKDLLADSDPPYGLNVDLLQHQPGFAPIRATQIELVSYTDQSGDLPSGFLAGELILGLDDNQTLTLPVRLGIETADWAYDGIASAQTVQHTKPTVYGSFPAYLSSIGREINGQKYIARYTIAPANAPLMIHSIGARTFLPDAGWMIEKINLVDEIGKPTSLAMLLNRSEFSMASRSHTYVMWENLTCLPRAILVHRAQIVSDEQVLTRMAERDWHPDQTIFLNEGEPLATQEDATGESVDIVEYLPMRVTIDVTAKASGILLLADSWYPGWHATVDGNEAPVYRADLIYRAVRVDAGEHRIVFEYRPASFAVGLMISAASILLALGLVLIATVGRKR